MRPISEDTRQNIIGDLQAGYSIRQVAYRTNVGRTTVNKVAAEHLPNRKKPKGGKPLKLKEADKRYCVR
jgi:transposase